MKKIVLVCFTGLFVFACVAKAAGSFSRDLSFGMQNNPDVVQLQQFLTGKGFYSGPINGNFFTLTMKAVKVFQAAQGISPATGYFGSASRAKANGLLSASGSAPEPTPSTVAALQSQIQRLLQQVAALQKQLQMLEQAQTVQNNTTTTASTATSSVVIVLQNPTSTAPLPEESVPYQINPPPQVSSAEFMSAVLGSDPACGSFSGGAPSDRSRTVVDNVSCFEFAADSAGLDVHLKSLALTFSGGALASTGAFAVSLIDPQTQIAYDGSSQQTCTPVNASCSATFNFSGTPINGGQIKGIVVQVNSANFSNAVGQNDGLEITLNSRDAISWDDGITTSGIPSDVSVPILLTHVDYQ